MALGGGVLRLEILPPQRYAPSVRATLCHPGHRVTVSSASPAADADDARIRRFVDALEAARQTRGDLGGSEELAAIAEALGYQPDDLAAYQAWLQRRLMKGETLLRSGLASRAQAEFEGVLALAPWEGGAKWGLAQALRDQANDTRLDELERYEAAERCVALCDRILDREPTRSDVAEVLAEAARVVDRSDGTGAAPDSAERGGALATSPEAPPAKRGVGSYVTIGVVALVAYLVLSKVPAIAVLAKPLLIAVLLFVAIGASC